jgi:hypothetical protein
LNFGGYGILSLSFGMSFFAFLRLNRFFFFFIDSSGDSGGGRAILRLFCCEELSFPLTKCEGDKIRILSTEDDDATSGVVGVVADDNDDDDDAALRLSSIGLVGDELAVEER